MSEGNLETTPETEEYATPSVSWSRAAGSGRLPRDCKRVKFLRPTRTGFSNPGEFLLGRKFVSFDERIDSRMKFD